MKNRDPMKRSRRGKYEIILDILEISIKGIRKTQIMYKANLSFAQLKNYLHLLNDRGLLEEKDGTYKVTEKGLEFVRTGKELFNYLA